MTDLAILQQKLGMPGSDAWSAATQAAVVKLQLERGLPATGAPDPPTLANAGVYDPITEAPTGKGTFGRDIVTALNQVPQWAWLVLAGLSGTVAYVAYRRRNPGKS
jgi:hypothetical protein